HHCNVVYDAIAFFFFFQAEDGIRDWSVTGVQTCALPILPPRLDRFGGELFASEGVETSGRTGNESDGTTQHHSGRSDLAPGRARSEERRVGKEWRCRGSTGH